MPKHNINRIPAFCVCIAVTSLLAACATVKPYQRIYLNDANMKLGKADIEKFDESVHTYREGASGGGNGKGSGGCGCN
ncbi:uncharacterized protein DUF4266 [Chitinophaga niastensis]|uniref:Uncharacterized protein DUF4266 n=1 Tax=Chitinophaga niastensis TaxID=536980 RepID=A0A2P8HDG9_CHINA|nr:DUF4266 domain-containing protein [Chitinophaga niastensis]PSL44286.1 uncharacterized protein DUF4266 [Chitinophaga niastensis]